jgi:hypothetical protein
MLNIYRIRQICYILYFKYIDERIWFNFFVLKIYIEFIEPGFIPKLDKGQSISAKNSYPANQVYPAKRSHSNGRQHLIYTKLGSILQLSVQGWTKRFNYVVLVYIFCYSVKSRMFCDVTT